MQAAHNHQMRTCHRSSASLVVSSSISVSSRRPRVCVHASTSNSSDAVKDFTKTAKSKFTSFVKDAQPKVEAAAEDLLASARRTYTKLDSEYEITEKANRAAKRMKETAKDVDQEYGVRRRLRLLTEDVKQKWPVWSRRFQEYSQTPIGKFTIITGVLLIMTTSFFWRVLNWLVFLWWLALPLASFALQRAQVKQAEQAAAEEAERRRNPFASMFRGAGGSSGRSSKKASSSKDSGPIIDAEWRPLDDK